MNYAISGITAILCIVMTYFVLDEEKASKIKILHKLGHGEAYENIKLSRKAYWTLLVIISLFDAIVCFWIATHTLEVINVIKMSVGVLCLTGAASNDLREHRIPNIFPLTIAVVGIGCLVAGWLTEMPGWGGYIASSVIATVATGLCFGLAFFLSKNGIGMGDIKILCAIALLAGVYPICGTVFFGIVSCSILSIALLIFKKKGFKDTLPFGPFILLGFGISILLTIY